MSLEFVLMICTAGGMGTFLFSQLSIVGPIRASAILSLGFISVTKYLNYMFDLSIPDVSHTVFFGASFVGMASANRFKWYQILQASLLFGLMYVYLIPFFDGIGGALGASAFLSCLSVLMVSLPSCFKNSGFMEIHGYRV